MEFHILSFFSVVVFHLAYIYGVQNDFYYFWTGTQHALLHRGGKKDIETGDKQRETMRCGSIQWIIIVVCFCMRSRKSIVHIYTFQSCFPVVVIVTTILWASVAHRFLSGFHHQFVFFNQKKEERVQCCWHLNNVSIYELFMIHKMRLHRRKRSFRFFSVDFILVEAIKDNTKNENGIKNKVRPV